ncbi:hypothetical protein H9P43_005574 [Blastocladiella emersonii ATCC 22665]|nr:hypothetical protein H9P43_005574 [Blastocladiella emersonii ATCC 22665]
MTTDELDHTGSVPDGVTVLSRTPWAGPPRLAEHVVAEGDPVHMSYYMTRPDGSVIAASHASYPHVPHLHVPGKGIVQGLDAAIVGMRCGDRATFRVAGDAMTPRHPTVAVDLAEPFVDVQVEILALPWRPYSEPASAWLARAESTKSAANALLTSGADRVTAVKLYFALADQATTALAHAANLDPAAAAHLAAACHLNLALAYLHLQEPAWAERHARAVFLLADSTTSLTGAPSLEKMLNEPHQVRGPVPLASLEKAAFRLARALDAQGKEADVRRVAGEAAAAFPAAKATFDALVAELDKREDKARGVYKRMFAADAAATAAAAAKPASPTPAPANGKTAKGAKGKAGRGTPPPPAMSEEESLRLAEAAWLATENMEFPENEPFLEEQPGLGDDDLSSDEDEDDPREVVEHDISEEKKKKRKSPSPVAEPAAPALAPAPELIHTPRSERPTPPPAPPLSDILASLDFADMHTTLAKVYRAREHYRVPALLAYVSRNLAHLRPWLNPYPDLTHPVAEAVVTRLVATGVLELYMDDAEALPDESVVRSRRGAERTVVTTVRRVHLGELMDPADLAAPVPVLPLFNQQAAGVLKFALAPDPAAAVFSVASMSPRDLVRAFTGLSLPEIQSALAEPADRELLRGIHAMVLRVRDRGRTYKLDGIVNSIATGNAALEPATVVVPEADAPAAKERAAYGRGQPRQTEEQTEAQRVRQAAEFEGRRGLAWKRAVQLAREGMLEILPWASQASSVTKVVVHGLEEV